MYLPLSKIVCFSSLFFFCVFLQQLCLSAAIRDETDGNEEAKLCEKISSMEEKLLTLERYVSEMQQDNCPVGGCPIGSMKYGNKCLLFVYHQKKSWQDAANYCASMAGKMVSVNSKRMQRRIKKFLKAQLGRQALGMTSMYTGLVYTHGGARGPYYSGDVAISGKADGWYWHSLGDSSFTRLKDSDFSNWVDNHPHPYSNSTVFAESCMHMEGPGMKWVSSHCTVERYFICEFSAVCEKKRRKGRRQKQGPSRSRGERKRKGKKRD